MHHLCRLSGCSLMMGVAANGQTKLAPGIGRLRRRTAVCTCLSVQPKLWDCGGDDCVVSVLADGVPGVVLLAVHVAQFWSDFVLRILVLVSKRFGFLNVRGTS